LTSTRPKPPFKLKPLPEGGYSGRACAAEGCDQPSDLIDGTLRIWDEDVPLCDEHYAQRPGAPLQELVKTKVIKPVVEVEQDDDDPDLYHIAVNPRSFKLFG
jgi:hypothetical protein